MADSREKIKVLVMAFLVIGTFLMSIYLHRVAGIGVILVHFFYFPIILAGVWWKRKGLIVPVSILFLQYSYRFFLFDYSFLLALDDGLRSIMYISVGYFTAILIEKMAIADEKLRKSHEELEKLVEKRTGSLKIANEQLQQEIFERERAEKALTKSYEELKSQEQFKTNIISNVSHELRTPMSIAFTAIELALDEEDTQKKKYLLGKGKNALLRQERTVDNLLKVASSQKEFNIEEIDLGNLIRSTTEKIKTFSEDKGIEMKVEAPEILVMADLEEIKKALANILENAIKFTDKGGRVKVSADLNGKDIARIRIEDTGIGIPEEFHEKIFDRLFQVDPKTTRRFGGIGMGLSVARDIVEGHGGLIRVEENPGGGSIFNIFLPKEGKVSGK